MASRFGPCAVSPLGIAGGRRERIAFDALEKKDLTPMHGSALFIAVFLACAVEAVEAVTIVIAAGVGGSWKSAMRGVYAALATLAAIIFTFGPLITRIPISTLQIIIGTLLLVFGLQWVRKAVLRSSGWKALHDEAEIFQEELEHVKAAAKETRFGVSDWYAFTLAYKGVFLEGLEVAFIVLTFGALQHQVPLASIAAVTAAVAAATAGVLVRGPLTRVPENTMKYVVGVMLVSFGIFWSAEGAGAHWPHADLALIAIIAFTVAVSRVLIYVLKRAHARTSPVVPAPATAPVLSSIDAPTAKISDATYFAGGIGGCKTEAESVVTRRPSRVITALRTFAHFWIDFIIGDDWRGTVIITVGVAATRALSPNSASTWLLMPLVVCVALATNLLPRRVFRAR